MGPGVVGDAAAQFQRMGIQGTADLPRPTIRPAQNFSAERDADIIRKAMKGMGNYDYHCFWLPRQHIEQCMRI